MLAGYALSNENGPHNTLKADSTVSTDTLATSFFRLRVLSSGRSMVIPAEQRRPLLEPRPKGNGGISLAGEPSPPAANFGIGRACRTSGGQSAVRRDHTSCIVERKKGRKKLNIEMDAAETEKDGKTSDIPRGERVKPPVRRIHIYRNINVFIDGR